MQKILLVVLITGISVSGSLYFYQPAVSWSCGWMAGYICALILNGHYRRSR